MGRILCIVEIKSKNLAGKVFQHLVFGGFIGAIWANSGDDGIGEFVLKEFGKLKVNEILLQNCLYSALICGIFYHVNRLRRNKIKVIQQVSIKVIDFMGKTAEVFITALSAFIVCLMFREGYGLGATGVPLMLLLLVIILYFTGYTLWREMNLIITRIITDCRKKAINPVIGTGLILMIYLLTRPLRWHD